jgi:hypothetical protein
VNLRIPLALLAQVDRSSAQLEVQTGLKAKRGMSARRAFALFLETRAPGKRQRSLERTKRAALGIGQFLSYIPLSPS